MPGLLSVVDLLTIGFIVPIAFVIYVFGMLVRQ
jgi:hypothetical protein